MLNSRATVSEFIFDSVSTMAKRNFSILSDTPDLQDARGIHDFRVEIRRMRSVLKSCISLLDPAWGEKYLKELQSVDEMISPVRNTQVLLDRFEGYPESMKNSNIQLLDILREDLKKYQTQLQSDLDSPTFKQFFSYQYFETNESILSTHSNEPVIKYLEHFNLIAWESLARAAVKADETQLHKVRIKAKRVKYLAEASLPVVGKSLKSRTKTAAKIQSTLGYLQDSIMMTAIASSPEVLEYEKRERKEIRNNWEKFVKHNF